MQYKPSLSSPSFSNQSQPHAEPVIRNPHLIPAFLLDLRRSQHAHPISSPPPFTPKLQRQIIHLPRPASRDHDTTDDIDQPDNQGPESTPLLHNTQRDRLDVEFDKYSRYALLWYGVRLRGDGVLVGLDGVLTEHAGGAGRVCRVEGFQRLERVRVNGGDDGEVILELVEVVVGGWGESNSVVERVVHGGEVRAERHLADDVGKVER